MWFESLLVFILFKFKKRPNISGIRVVDMSLTEKKIFYNFHFMGYFFVKSQKRCY